MMIQKKKKTSREARRRETRGHAEDRIAMDLATAESRADADQDRHRAEVLHRDNDQHLKGNPSGEAVHRADRRPEAGNYNRDVRGSTLSCTLDYPSPMPSPADNYRRK